mgnify:CR=1 FL=1
MTIHKLAGIDLGSNSVRLLITNVIDNGVDLPVFKKSSLTRLPIRLGDDAFGKGAIQKSTRNRLTLGMIAYANIMKVHGVEKFRACATSALRDSKNGEEIIAHIKKKTGIEIELISGKEEAKIIFSSGMTDVMKGSDETFLYIDVGGGSTELTLFHNDLVIASKSFKIGTIRLLKNQVAKSTWKQMEKWVKEVTSDIENIIMVGSGGNINRTFKLSGQAIGSILEIDYIQNTYDILLEFSTEERIIKFDLNPDRADVITHALGIYLSAMKWAKSTKMTVPKKGLADGMVRDLYRRTKKKKK